MIATLTKTARALVPDRAKCHAAKLEAAIAELRCLESRRREIDAEMRKRADISFFVEAEKQAASKHTQTQSPQDLRDLLLAEIVLEKARQRVAIVQLEERYGVADNKFRSEFPNFCEVLGQACELKLQAAKVELDRITCEETQRLSGEGFEPEQIDKSPVVARARSVVQGWEVRLKKIQEDLPEACWTNNAPALLEK